MSPTAATMLLGEKVRGVVPVPPTRTTWTVVPAAAKALPMLNAADSARVVNCIFAFIWI
jgi:hypothetical protein